MPRFLPKSVVCYREGYTKPRVTADLVAGVTVGIIALPLAMAFGIASIPESVAVKEGISPPAVGMYTAVVAGLIVALFGGSRVQIAGPTGAFIVIIYGIAQKHGFSGLATATLMAGLIIIVMGLSGFGAMIKFIPYPVTTGFTTGIAVIIFSSQIRDFFGLAMKEVPAEFIAKWQAYGASASTWDGSTFAVGAGSLILLMVVQRYIKRLPPAITAVVVMTAIVWILKLPVATVGSRFGDLPRTLPVPHMPAFSFDLAMHLLPEAATIAFLASIESLLSAVVADGMIGGRHKADCELVAQGLANVGSVVFGGIPATGAIARTVANIRSGGRTPLAAAVHSVTLVAVMAALAPLAAHIPLPTLAAVLMLVAYNMSEIDHFRSILRAPASDVVVLLATFGLTVFTDLTKAVGAGVVLASVLFMRRMAEVSTVSEITDEIDKQDEDEDDPDATSKKDVPADVDVFEINGPFFFGVADRLKDVLRQQQPPPKIFILRMRKVPAIDASGMQALREFHWKCQRQGITLILSGVHSQPHEALENSGLLDQIGDENVKSHIDLALDRAREVLATKAV
ncbi:MAG: sulfate permease [Candidatus Hydrogenedentes bacterium]|nr:sulfate permease [Candidatus Hydrogenedentota bacterium]